MHRRVTPEIRRRLELDQFITQRPPSSRYWMLEVPRGRSWAFLFSTEAVVIDGSRRFLATMYRLEGLFLDGRRFANRAAVPKKLQGEDIEERWELVRTVEFAVRWKAKDRAWKWYCQKTGQAFASLHVPPRHSRAQIAQRRSSGGEA